MFVVFIVVMLLMKMSDGFIELVGIVVFIFVIIDYVYKI